nr:MAG TPA: cysteine protease [Caudoviricetes sp.]
MVRYRFTEEQGRAIMCITGHAAECGAPAGENIVCAAISAVADMVYVGCTHFDKSAEVKEAVGDIFVSCRLMAETRGIMMAARLELLRIEESHPDCFVREG